MNPYEEIINLPHHVSTVHPPMSIHDRAAQFAPFAALRGYDKSIASAREKADKEAEAEYEYLPLEDDDSDLTDKT